MYIKELKKYITTKRDVFFRIALKYIDENSKILDIGAGEGDFAKEINRNDVYMLEGNEQTVKKLKEEFENVTHSDVEKLPYADDFFDVIHTSHLVEHLMPENLYNLLKEINRCLKPGGVLIISAPLLWTSFYCDMSHIKPYYPSVFENYLCRKNTPNRTREGIKGNYKTIETVYRYNIKRPDPYSFINIKSPVLNQIFQLIRKLIYKLGFMRLEVSGFTMVLKKQ